MIAGFWRERTAREQLLIGAAGGLAALLIVSQLIAGPILNARSSAKAAFMAADSGWREVNEGVAQLGALQSTSAAAAQTGSLRSVVSSTATQFGLAIARVQPGEDGELSVSLENASSPDLYRWLRELQDRHGVVVRSASLRRSERDIVLRARLTLAARER